MIKNYIKIAIRNILKYKSYSFINIIGLAGSSAITILIAFYSLSVLSFDQFHEDADRIYFMHRDRATESDRMAVYDTWFPMTEVAISEFASVESGTRAFTAGRLWVKYGTKRFEQRLMYADSAFFSFFSFPIIEGDRNTGRSQLCCHFQSSCRQILW